MKRNFKTKEQILKELEEMRHKVLQVEACRIEVQKTQEKYEELLNSSPDALVFVNKESEIVLTNAQFERMFKYDHDEVIGQKLDILVPERFRGKHEIFVNHFFQRPKIRPMGSDLEIYALKKKGEEFPADISLSLIQTDEGVLVMAAIRDITKRRQAEEQVELNYATQRVINSMLRLSLKPLPLQEQFEQILEMILSVPYLSLHSKGAIYLAENEPETLVLKAQRGFTASEIIPCRNVPFGKCLCGKAASLSQIMYSDAVNDRHEIHHKEIFPHGHYCVPIALGEHPLGLLNIYVKEGHKRNIREEEFLISVANNLATIIDRDRAEQEKKRLQEMLSQSEKLAALGRFTANVAHEIRNPLTAIGGFTRRLDKGIAKGTKEKEYATFIISEVKRLEGILNNVLSYSRDSSPSLEKNNIHEIIDTVLMEYEEKCTTQSIKIQKNFNAVPEILIDKNQMHELLENIILNAIDSMPDGGLISIDTKNILQFGMSYLNIVISDSGKGISDEDLKLIFEPFFTTKIAEKGTGLGLPIAKKIMDALRGSIEVKSQLGKGSSVKLAIPYR